MISKQLQSKNIGVCCIQLTYKYKYANIYLLHMLRNTSWSRVYDDPLSLFTSLHSLLHMIPICIWVPPVRLTSFTFPVHSHARSHFITLYSFDTRFSIIYSSGKYLYSVLQFIVYPLIMMYSVTYVEDVYLHIICKEFVVNMQI